MLIKTLIIYNLYMKNLLTFKEQDEVLFDLDFLMGFGWQAGTENRAGGLSPSPDHHLFQSLLEFQVELMRES